MSLVVHHRLEEISPAIWDGLVARAVTGTSFQTYGWHRAWLDVYGSAEGLFLVCVYKEGRLLVIAPLRLEKKHGRRVLKFIGDERADYADLIYAPEDAASVEAIFTFLSRKDRVVDEIELNNIPSDSPTVQSLRGLVSQRKWWMVWGADEPCPTLLLKGQDEFVQHLLAKKSLRHSLKYYETQGTLELRHTHDPAEIHTELKSFFNQHIQRWSVRGPQSLFVVRENREFYRRLVGTLAPTGRLLFTSLRFAGRPIAYHFGFLDGKRLIWYKPTFDLAESEHYPGGVFLKKVIESALKDGLAELDFTRGDEFYKTRFANHVRYNRDLTLTRSVACALELWVKETVRRVPPLLRMARSGMDLIKEAARPGRGQTPGGGRPGVVMVYDDDQYGRFDSRLVVEQYGWEKGLRRPEVGILNRFRPELPKMKMLNAGTGIGGASLYFAPLAREYSAFDESFEVVRAAREFVGDYIDHRVFVRGDVRRMPYPDNAGFDLILLDDTVLDRLAVKDRRPVFDEVRRVSRDGAWFCVAAHNLQSLTVRGGRGGLGFWKSFCRYHRLETVNRDLAASSSREAVLIQDPDAGCEGPIYYIKPRAQAEELKAAGFSEVSIISLDSGLETPVGEWDSLTDVWLYYICRVVKTRL